MSITVEPLNAVAVEEHLDALAQLLQNGALTGNAFYFLRLPNSD